MKAKLLKKLRKKHIIQNRNNEYRYFCTEEKDRGHYDSSKWEKSLGVVRNIRRRKILEEAQFYKEPKKTIKP